MFGFRTNLVVLAVLPVITAAGSAQPRLHAQETVTSEEFERLQRELFELRRQVESREVPSSELLAPPVDPQRIIRTGDFHGAFLIPGTDVSLRIGGYARVDSLYDSGFVATGIQLFPSSIALDGSPLAGRRGQTKITGSQSRLNFDAQAETDVGRLRGFVELDFLQNDVNPRLRHAFGQWEVGETTLIGGQTWSTFMDPASLPFVVPETTAVGAIFRRQGMLRVQHQWNDCTSLALALEAPTDSDYTLPTPTTDQVFGRYPDLIARVRFSDCRSRTLQVASLVRGIGFEDAMGRETERVGWGLAVTGRVDAGERDNVRFGATGGEGIGSYIAGFGTDQSAAGPDIDGYRTLGAVGAYAAYQHFWCEDWFSNTYYGYSQVHSTRLMPVTAAKRTENVGLNLIWSPRSTFGIGLEYTYAIREVRDGISGDNHRIQFTVQFGP